MYMYLEHHITEDIVGKCLSLSTLVLKVVPELPDDMGHRLLSSSGKGGLVLLQEGVQVHLLKQF